MGPDETDEPIGEQLVGGGPTLLLARRLPLSHLTTLKSLTFNPHPGAGHALSDRLVIVSTQRLDC